MTTHADTVLTAEQFDALGGIGRVELVRGKVISLTWSKPRHGRVAMQLGRIIANFVVEQGLGEVYAAETGFLVERNPDSVRAPDVSFVRAEIAAGHDDRQWYPHAPDLAVEVLSPTDRRKDVEKKVEMWLNAGARSVWLVDPENRTINVRRSDGSIQLVRQDETLRDETVLPGFLIDPLDEIFSR